MPNCQQIKEKFADIKADAADIVDVLDQYKQTGNQETKQNLTEALEKLNLKDFNQYIKEHINDLLSEHPQAKEFTGKVVVEGGKVVIDGDIDFKETNTTHFPQMITRITGEADFYKSSITDLRNLQNIGGFASFQDSDVKYLSNLRTIGGSANFEDSRIKDLSNLQKINGKASFIDSSIKDLSSLKEINGWASFRGSQVNDVSRLQKIDGHVVVDKYRNLDLSHVRITGKIMRR